MPIAFFAAVFSALSSAATFLTTTTVAGISLATIGKFVVGVGLSVWTQSKQSDVTLRSQSVVNDALGERQIGYGLCLLGGTRVYREMHNREYWQVLVFHHGRVNKIKRFLIGGVKVDLDEQNRVTTEPWKRGSDRYYVNIWSKRGFTEQQAYPELIAASEGAWTSKHKLNGLASALVKFDHAREDRYASLYPRGVETEVQVIAETSRVYDPRTGSREYSTNSALIIRDHLIREEGFPNITERDIDEESIAAYADLCDRNRNTPEGPEPMFTTNGVYWMSEVAKDVHARLAAACDAKVYITPKGKIGLRGGQWVEPRYTFSDQDVIMEFQLEEGPAGFNWFNQLHTYYTDPKQGFQRVEAPLWFDSESIARTGKRKSKLYLDMVDSPFQAEFLAQIHGAKNNPKWTGKIVATLDIVEALGDPVIRIKHSEFDMDEVFLINKFNIRTDLSGVELTVSSISRDAYKPIKGIRKTPDLPDYYPDLSVPVPQIVSLTFNANDRIRLEVQEPGFEDLSLEAEMQPPGDDWESMSVTEYIAKSGAVNTADTYSVRMRFKSGASVGEWWTTTLT